MQSSPNLTHSGSNVPNLSLNFQNLSPIVNSQGLAQNSNTPQFPDLEFHRINSQMAMTSSQYNGNIQVINYIMHNCLKKSDIKIHKVVKYENFR